MCSGGPPKKSISGKPYPKDTTLNPISLISSPTGAALSLLVCALSFVSPNPTLLLCCQKNFSTADPSPLPDGVLRKPPTTTRKRSFNISWRRQDKSAKWRSPDGAVEEAAICLGSSHLLRKSWGRGRLHVAAQTRSLNSMRTMPHAG